MTNPLATRTQRETSRETTSREPTSREPTSRETTSRRRSRARRGVTVFELVAAAALLLSGMVMVAHAAAKAGQFWRESQQRTLALDLAGAAMERVWLVDPAELDPSLKTIGEDSAVESHQVEVIGDEPQDGQRRIVVKVRWTQENGQSAELQLEAWRAPAESPGEPREETP